MNWPLFTDREVLAGRPAKNRLDPWKPYAFLVEPELSATRIVEDVQTVFLTNRECPFRCTMCDLWMNTLDSRVPIGAIPAQIDYARERLPSAQHIKLYNAGNFFDTRAIPPEDHDLIAERLQEMKTVIVENHPLLTDERCLPFRDQLPGQLEIALGLETIHPQALASLNKRMTVEDFNRAADFLRQECIYLRTFLLLNPPGLSGDESVEWAIRSVEHVVNRGARCISLIPTRAGNGLMDQLKSSGMFRPPKIWDLELAMERGLNLVQRLNPDARLFVDLWDVQQFYDCPACGPARSDRIQRMNLSQQVEPLIDCPECRQKSDLGPV